MLTFHKVINYENEWRNELFIFIPHGEISLLDILILQ